MLVLTRKAGERILVGDKIVITVVRIGPMAIRLGIEAPIGENIVREELLLGSIEDEQLRQSTFEAHYAEMTGDVAPSAPPLPGND
jgi:carbon storage regulator